MKEGCGHNRKRIITVLGAAAVVLLLWNIPLQDLSREGQRCLALSAGAIILWALEAMPLGYTSMLLLMGYSLTLDPVAGPLDIFGFFTKPMAYMIISGFIIAGAVKNSGLGHRISLFLISRFISDYRQVIICCYGLSYIMALMIPQPFARAFLILSIMEMLLKEVHLEKKYMANIVLAVFGAQNGAGMLFMTADSSLNMMILSQIPEAFRPGWGSWTLYMVVPALFTGICMCGLQLLFFGKPEGFSLDKARAERELEKLGAFTGKELRMMFWLAAAVAFWLTDSIHGIDAAWVGVAAVIGMSLPAVGGLVGEEQLKEINVNTLLFLCASMSIGVVGTKTGMSSFLAAHLLPSDLGTGTAAAFLTIATACLLVHLMLGSIMAVFALLVPALLTMTQGGILPPLAVGLLVYILAVGQWFLPYESLSLTIGMGASGDSYSVKTASGFGLLYTIPALLCGAVALGWWDLIGMF